MDTRGKGKAGEDLAAEYLVENGYTIISRNYQSRKGEIDCIAESPKGELVFVEVKWARDLSRGHPFTWVTRAKQKNIIAMARQYFADHNTAQQACRFDVIAIVGGKLEHMPKAFIA